MIRSFDKDKFLTILCDRPATIRHLQKPDDKYLARCLAANERVVEYTDKSWLTLHVLQELISLFFSSRYAPYGILDSFPVSVLDSLPEKNLRKLCGGCERAVLKFPNAPYDMFLAYVKREFSYPEYAEIPEQHRTEELLAELFTNRNGAGGIPDEAFTDKIVDVSLGKKPECINHIPFKFLTRERLIRAFQKESSLELVREDIPQDIWNQELADLATATGENLRYIPETLITKEMYLRAVAKSNTNLRYIPARRIDEDVALAAMVSGKLMIKGSALNVRRKFLLKML